MTITYKKRPSTTNHQLVKYWNQRYNLFSKFDEGIQLDDESWWSVTPENIARHIATRFSQVLGDGHSLILDAFCGVGGNLIQFACLSPLVRVICIDINPDRIEMAKHNAEIYGVRHQCEFVAGDFTDIVHTLRGRPIDAVFLSPPWGGVDYKDLTKYSLNSMVPNGYDLIYSCRKYVTSNIAFLMPRNVDLQEVKKNLLTREYPSFEWEENKVGKKVKTITAYFGDLVDQSIETDSEQEI